MAVVVAVVAQNMAGSGGGTCCPKLVTVEVVEALFVQNMGLSMCAHFWQVVAMHNNRSLLKLSAHA